MGPISHIGLISPISLGSVDYKKWGKFDAIADCEGIFVPKKERTPQPTVVGEEVRSLNFGAKSTRNMRLTTRLCPLPGKP